MPPFLILRLNLRIDNVAVARAAGLGLSSVLLRLNEHGDPALAHDWQAYLEREVTSYHPLKKDNRRWGT